MLFDSSDTDSFKILINAHMVGSAICAALWKATNTQSLCLRIAQTIMCESVCV